MSLAYNLHQRKVLAGDDAGKVKYFAHLKSGSRVSFDEVCEQVMKHCTYTYADVSAVVKSSLDEMSGFILDGFSVKLGRLGCFRPVAGSQGTDTEEEFKLSHMKKPRIAFTPGKALIEMSQKVGFRRDNPKVVVEYVVKDCDRQHTPG